MQTIKYPRWRNFKRASVRSERSWLMRKPFARSSSWRKLCISCRDKWQPRSRWDLKVLIIVFYCFFFFIIVIVIYLMFVFWDFFFFGFGQNPLVIFFLVLGPPLFSSSSSPTTPFSPLHNSLFLSFSHPLCFSFVEKVWMGMNRFTVQEMVLLMSHFLKILILIQ